MTAILLRERRGRGCGGGGSLDDIGRGRPPIFRWFGVFRSWWLVVADVVVVVVDGGGNPHMVDVGRGWGGRDVFVVVFVSN